MTLAGSASEAQQAPSPSPVDEPATPYGSGHRAPLSLSQVTLPSTEIPASPVDADQSFRTEPLDDGPQPAVIPSSLTPPPLSSTHVAAHDDGLRRSLLSPPAGVARPGSAFVPPTPQQVLDAAPDRLRAMLQTCITEHHRLKAEAAHHKLQYSLLTLQADEDSKRAVVEHEMVRREVDALRLSEHARQARRELSTAHDSAQARCLQDALHECASLRRRLKAAKKVIHRKEHEAMGLCEERDLLLTRIRENREHFHMLCSPGGIFHGALTPKLKAAPTPRPQRPAPQQAPKPRRRDEPHGPEPGLSALIQAMSAQESTGIANNNSAPSTPLSSHRAAQRHLGKHSRNAQSLSSLPTTPLHRAHGQGLLPSVDRVAPHTEPRHRSAHQHFGPTPPERDRRRRSRESTISVEDNEELARQAVELATAAQSLASRALRGPPPAAHARPRDLDSEEEGEEEEEEEDDNDGDDIGGGEGPVGGAEHDKDSLESRASQAAAGLLRWNPGLRYDAGASAGPRDRTPRPAEKSARMQARLLAGPGGYTLDKRKHGGVDGGGPERGSPPKRMRVGGPLTEDPRVGLGIQYGH